MVHIIDLSPQTDWRQCARHGQGNTEALKCAIRQRSTAISQGPGQTAQGKKPPGNCHAILRNIVQCTSLRKYCSLQGHVTHHLQHNMELQIQAESGTYTRKIWLSQL